MHGCLLFHALEATSPERAAAILERAISIAAERLGGDSFFAESAGHFWLILETRPYVRARSALAESYAECGRRLDAIAAYEAMLKLNPNDNQGILDYLLGQYLRAGDTYRAGQLVKRYENDRSAVFTYGTLLAQILDGNTATAKKSLRQARLANAHVFEHMIGAKEDLPENSPYYGYGDENEAAHCMECLSDAFVSCPQAFLFLVEQARAEPPKLIH